MKVTLKAYAKINLLLDILGKLPNGYHDLYMLMQSVSLYDTVSVEETDNRKVEIFCNVSDIPCDERNIAYKAVACFFEYTEIKNSGIKIEIEKGIPHAAGLAGGSADGAAVVRALQKMYAPSLTDREVSEICAMFGSDVPFCALGGTMLAQNDGTVLTYLPNLEIENVIIVKPDCSVSTAKAYAAFDSAEHVKHLDRKGVFEAALQKNNGEIYKRVNNVFEQFIDVPERVDIKAIMRKHNALCACMSGSGPSVFGVFETSEEAAKCAAELKETYKNTFLCKSVKSGVEIIS